MKGTRKLRQDDNLIFNISKQELTTTPVKLFEASNNEWQRICERASILGQSSMMIENSHAHTNEVHHFFVKALTHKKQNKLELCFHFYKSKLWTWIETKNSFKKIYDFFWKDRSMMLLFLRFELSNTYIKYLYGFPICYSKFF